MTPQRFENVLKNDIQFSVLQRLGYILDVVLENKELTEVLKKYLSKKRLFRVPLKAGSSKKGARVNADWKIIENFKIETDF